MTRRPIVSRSVDEGGAGYNDRHTPALCLPCEPVGFSLGTMIDRGEVAGPWRDLRGFIALSLVDRCERRGGPDIDSVLHASPFDPFEASAGPERKRTRLNSSDVAT